MMKSQQKIKKQINFAFIDSQNLNLEIQKLGWKLDWKQLYRYLQDKYRVTKAYLFIGYIPDNQKLYQFLKEIGFILIFKPVLEIEGTTKGNVDAELVLHTMIQYPNFDQAVIITGDGDFACLVAYLVQKDKLKILLAPNEKKYSKFLKHTSKGKIAFVSRLQKRLSYHTSRYTKKKRPL